MADPYRRDRRLGRWSLGWSFIEDWRTAVMLIQAQAIILEARYSGSRDQIEYFGQCEHFDIVERGIEAPYYDLEIDAPPKWPRVVRAVNFVKAAMPGTCLVTIMDSTIRQALKRSEDLRAGKIWT